MATSSQFFDPFFLLDKLAQEDASGLGADCASSEPSVLKRLGARSAQIYSKTVASFVPGSASNDVSSSDALEDGGEEGTHISTAYATTSFRYHDLLNLWAVDGLDGTTPGDMPEGFDPRPICPSSDGELQILGQGTIAVKAKLQKSLQIEVHTDGPVGQRMTLGLRIEDDNVEYYKLTKDGTRVTMPITPDVNKPVEDSYLEVGVETVYWLSIDRENGQIRVGKHFAHNNMTALEATYKTPNDKGELVWRSEREDAWMAKLRHVDIVQDGVGVKAPALRLSILPVPVVVDQSAWIVSNDEITLLDLASGNKTVPSNLPEACQRLYGNVAGQQIVLNDEEFPHFTDAIEWSCRNEEGWCHKRLKRKAGGKDPDATYLRITLGSNQGESPGIPYVLEIWPAGHYSSVHDHGDACAIIKVLHGEITATYYDTLHKRQPAVIGTADFKEGMITWLSPDHYQIHKLYNKSDKVCCTIQCYRYERADKRHFEGFRFQDGSGSIKDFTPNSDMAFVNFRKKMMVEWEVYGSKEKVGNGQATLNGGSVLPLLEK